MQDPIEQLATLIGADCIATDPLTLESHGRDWTRFYEPRPLAVVFPRNIEAVQSIVQFAARQRIALVPSGGRTGLSGGAVATDHELVVSLDKMNRILEFNEIELSVEVEAGVVTEALQNFAAAKGLLYPVDFASAGSSQIGGNIATNAGGIKVLRYGLTREWILGLTVVTGRGDILHLNKGLVKNATGYDLRHLFIGSEGTLGIIVGATIALTAAQNNPQVLLLAASRMQDVILVLQKFREGISLCAFEFFSEQALQHVLHERSGIHPFSEPAPYYVLLEYESTSTAEMENAMSAFEACLDAGWISDGVVSQSEAQRRELWSYREGISEAITPFTPYKNDISVRVSKVPEFLNAVQALVQKDYPQFQIIWFGHIGDGNVHLNILRPQEWTVADFKKECEQVSDGVMSIVEDFEGSISAEHGVGLLKRDQLGFTRSVEEIEIMKAIKAVFDPAAIMNPGKIFET
ncbi:MAG: FAD/FMN-containing dehydrogenase [Dinoroseobacter sp.]